MSILSLLVSIWLLLAVQSALAAPTGPVPLTGDVPVAQGWKTEVVIDGLVHPWSICWLPDGSALITERPGRLRMVQEGRLLPDPIPGLPKILAHGQGGLMDVAIHPDFETNRLVYLSAALGRPGANRTVVLRGRLAEGRLADAVVLFEVADDKAGGQHFGSRLLWLPDGTLLVSIGDGGNPPVAFAGAPIREQAQRLATHFGKILRLTEDGRPAPGNPFLDREDARAEIWTFGHRNIQGLARDPVSGRVWASEHGARGGDELNLIEGGANYGWPQATYSLEYWGPRISDVTTASGMRDPSVVWTPSKAPSGLAFYTGDRFPAWHGDLFSGALKFEEVRRIILDGEQVVGEEKLPIGQRVRDVRQGPDGYLYILTDEEAGQLLRIVP
jgi:glucose/arabinose dehydrogenase